MGTRDGELERRLAEARWVRALAARLVGEGAADDLAQDAWVVALERGPREERAWPAWIARVLRNLAGERRRSEEARRARERASAKAEAAQGPDVVERAETARRLAGHVLALEEPYRSTLLARYFDGLDANEIARRTGTKASTVRTRLERGLRQLRERLERAEGEGWQLALLPLLPTSGSLAPLTLGRLVSGSTVAGGLGMSVVTKLAVGVVVLGAGAWWFWSHEADEGVSRVEGAEQMERNVVAVLDPQPEAQVVEREAASAAVAAPNVVEPKESPWDATDRIAAELATEVEPGTIEGLVLRRGEPVSGGTVYFGRGYARGLPAEAGEQLGALDDGALEARTVGTDGRFRIVGLAAGDYWLGVDTGAGVGAQFGVKLLEDKPSRRVVVELGGARVEGHVYGEDGHPLPGVEVRVDLLRHGRNFVRFATAGADGSYAIDELPGGSGWAVVQPPQQRHLSADSLWMLELAGLAPDEQRRIDFGSPQPRVRFTGRILDAAGQLVALDGELSHESEADGAYAQTAFRAGSFELRLVEGTHRLRVSLHVPNGIGPNRVPLGTKNLSGAEVVADLVLPGATVRGALLGFQASPTQGTLYASLARPTAPPQQSCELGADGTYRFHAVGAGEWILRIGGNGASLGELPFEVLDTDLTLEVNVPARAR